ncbi:MAG TPA: hypothetical protein VFC39_09135, partial [Acidobacteriaceae bacterium]|nr:hypothetical protein [Acidobacteriaceae bacterium]
TLTRLNQPDRLLLELKRVTPSLRLRHLRFPFALQQLAKGYVLRGQGQYTVKLGGSQMRLVPFHSVKSNLLGMATAGASDRIRKSSVLFGLMDGEHFEFRQEGDAHIRIKAKNRESVYILYFGP